MDDTPFINDGADTSLRKTVSLLNKIEAKTGSTTITGPVTVSNEVEVTNSTGSPIPVSGSVSVSNFPATQPVSIASAPVTPVTDNGGSLTVDGTVELGATSLSALENISVTFPDTQNVNVKNVPAITATGANHPVTSFTASTKTITIANFQNAPVIGNFLLITNTKLGVIVHNSADPQKICTFGSPNYNGQFYTITATFPASVDTAGMQDSDTFHVVYAPVAIGNPLASQVQLVGRAQNGSTSSILLSTDRTGALQVDAGVTFPLGATNESAATTDTASSGINGLLKRLLQRLTTLLPANLTVSSTRLLVDGSGVTQPVSGTVTAAQGTAANLNATVVQGTFTNLKTASEVYTNGSPIGSGNALTVKTNTTYGGNLPIVVPGYFQSGLNSYLAVSDGSGFPVRQANSTTFAVTGTFWQATQPVSIASAPVTPVTDNGGSLTVDGTVNTYPLQGTTVSNTDFSSITSAQLAPASANREVLTVHNEGAGTLFINVGASASTTSYQVRLLAGDYWEAPAGQQSLQHSGIFGSAGTARVTQVT